MQGGGGGSSKKKFFRESLLVRSDGVKPDLSTTNYTSCCAAPAKQESSGSYPFIKPETELIRATTGTYARCLRLQCQNYEPSGYCGLNDWNREDMFRLGLSKDKDAPYFMSFSSPKPVSIDSLRSNDPKSLLSQHTTE
jgi:hypothetical protein